MRDRPPATAGLLARRGIATTTATTRAPDGGPIFQGELPGVILQGEPVVIGEPLPCGSSRLPSSAVRMRMGGATSADTPCPAAPESVSKTVTSTTTTAAVTPRPGAPASPAHCLAAAARAACAAVATCWPSSTLRALLPLLPRRR